MVTFRPPCTTLVLLLLILSNGLISLATGDEADVASGQQITTITTSSSEPCMFNRFCTCVTENIQSVAPQQPSADAALLDSTLENNSSLAEDLLNSFNIDQHANTVYSHSKLYEITCLNSPFYTVPKIPSGHLYRLNLIGAKQLSRIRSSSFVQTQISSITITRSKVQVIDNEAFQGSEGTLTALDLSLNELTEYPSAALKRLPILQWLSLKGNRIEEIRASDIFSQPQPTKESNGRYRVRRSVKKHHLSNRCNTLKHSRYGKHKRVRRQDADYKIPENVDWIVTKQEKDLRPDDQVLLRRTARKRHRPHAKHQPHKTRNRMFATTSDKINDDRTTASPLDGYQNDDSAHQVLKEDTPDNGQESYNQTDQTDQQNESIDHGILSLRSLILSDNYLTTITGQTFASLTNLDALDLDNNLIFKIESKPFPVSLGSLSLANNLLEKLPVHSLRPLKQLKWLQLRGNMLKSLPEEWPFSTNQIEILDLSRNLISSLNGFFAHSIGQKQTRSKITLYTKNDDQSRQQQNASQLSIQIKDLLLDNNLLRSLPEDTFASCQIERLILSNNRLSTLSSNLFANSPLSNSLKILDLSNNQIEQLDDSLAGLKKLQTLFARNNQLAKLDESTFKASADTLQILDLSGNQFTQVPNQSFEPIKRLFKLNLQGNQLQRLTRHDFQQWSKSLLSIQLNKNQIERIERDTFKFCSNLRELRLASNRLHNVNSELFVPLGRKLSILELSDLDAESSGLQSNAGEQTANLSSSIKDGVSKLKNIEFLELNHNSLNEITGQTLSSLSNLVHLDLEGNNLAVLGRDLFNASKHTKLRNLILTDNRLHSIEPFTFAHLRQVINIALIGNQLQIVESNAFVDLPQLQTILLSRNRLRAIRTSAFNSLRNLRNLFMQYNQLDELSLDMFNNTDLLVRNKMMLNDEQPRALNPNIYGKFNLQNGQQLPSQFGNQISTGLHLNASHNRIRQLVGLSNSKPKSRQENSSSPNSITNEIESEDEYQLNLSVLDLSYNQLSKLNSQFFQIIGKNLIKLVLNHNQLDAFPLASLSQCANLQLLSLRNNQIQDLIATNHSTLHNKEFVDYSQLQVLDLAFNQISNLTAFKPILATSAKLIYLDLSTNRISNLVDNTFNGTAIQHLDLSANQLMDLPFTLNCYGLRDHLVSLNLDHNQLSSLPKELNSCTNLNHLSIRSNQLAEIGSLAFAKLDYLLQLDLSANTFYSIQNDAFDGLINLRKLSLSSCNLDALPSLNDCTELIELDLSNNSLTLPVLQQPFNALSKFSSIFKCRKLKQLNLSSNQLSEVPRQLWKYLNSITELDLSSNPIELLDSSSLSELRNLHVIDIRNLQLKYVDSRVFHNHRHLTYIKTSTYPNVRSFRLYDLLAKMFSVRRALIHVEEKILSHQLQWAFGSKIKELTITGENLHTILPDAFLGLYHTTDFVLRITKTNITELPDGLLRYLTLIDLKYITLDLSDNRLTSLNRDVLFFGKDQSKKSLFTGGLHVQRNNFKCSCDLLWLKDWYERWLKESRKAQLLSHEHYLKNYQILDQITCAQSRPLVHSRIESPIKLDFLKLLPYTVELNKPTDNDVSTTGREIGIFNLNKDDLDCSNSANSSLNHLTYHLLNAILIYWIVTFINL